MIIHYPVNRVKEFFIFFYIVMSVVFAVLYFLINRVGGGDYPPSSHSTAHAVPQAAVQLFKDVPVPCTTYS